MIDRIYLAGPEVFLAAAPKIALAKKRLCGERGLEGVFPLDNKLNLEDMSPEEQGLAIYRANRALMDSCDFLIANVTPFRGPSADAGTIFEMGYMRGLGRRVLAYSNAAAPFAERSRAWVGEALRPRAGDKRPADEFGMEIEDFGLTDNLMIDGAVRESEEDIVTREVPAAERYTDLEGFKLCLDRAVRLLGG